MTTTTSSATNYWTATAVAATTAVTVSNPETADSLHAAGPYNFKLTTEERRVKSGQHKFGLCDSCDAGLNDRADFHCHFDDTKMTLTCNACDAYFSGGDS